MSAPQTVTWKWDEARGLAEFAKAKRVMADAEAHNSRRLDAMVFRRKAEANPWGEGATTLEWTLSSPPPFHQFNELPVVKQDEH